MKWSLLDTEEETIKEIPRGEHTDEPGLLRRDLLAKTDDDTRKASPSAVTVTDHSKSSYKSSVFANEVKQSSENADSDLGVKPLSSEPARISLLSHFTFTFLIIAIVAGALAGAGWYFRDEVKAGFARFNTPVTAIHKYTIRTLDDPANDVGLYSDIAIGHDGYPVISYRDATALSLKLYKCNDAACTTGTASTLDDPANNVGYYTSITIGRDGYPVISYYDATAHSLKLYKCNNVACTSGTASTLDDPANWVGFWTTIAIGSDGFPVISHQDWTAQSLKFYKCNDAACTTGTASTLDDPANNVGQEPSIAIGHDGFPIISYNDNSAQSLKFYKCNDAACTTGTASTLDDSANQLADITSIAIGSDGFPAISYTDSTIGALKFLKCADISCGSTNALTLSTGSSNGVNSIAIGRDGYPAISYYTTGSKDLKLLKCGNASCTATSTITIDSMGDVGQYTSMKIGQDGYPVISYYDNTNKSLKFAYLGARVTMNTSPKTIETDGLVGYWTFDGQDITGTSTVLDRSSSHATGTMVNMATSSRVMGKHGQALLFNGVSGYINAGSSSSLDDLTSLTFSVWIYPNQTIYGPTGRIAFKGSGSDFSDSYLYLGWMLGSDDSGVNKLTFAQKFSTTNLIKKSTTNSWKTNEWQHVVVTWNGSNQASGVHMYVNGTEVSYSSSQDGVGSIIGDNAYDLIIGYGGSVFNGMLDDVRIYNRVLSVDEISKLYGAGAGVKQGICGEGGVRDADGNVYGIVQIGTQCWLDRNMNVGTRINAAGAQTNNYIIQKYCYSDTPSNCTDNHPKRPDGGLYQWDEAMQYKTTEGAQGICPYGWHIPTDAEWYTLENYLKNNGASCDAGRSNVFACSDAGAKLKSSGSSLFEMNLTGNALGGSFYSRNSYGSYWSSSESGTNAWERQVTSAVTVNRYADFKSAAISVRCIKGVGDPPAVEPSQ